MNIYEKLLSIQNELKVPKKQHNDYGNYYFRNAEDILEAVKPLCLKHKTVLKVTDTIKQIGDRYYIEATAELRDIDKTDNVITNVAYAREEDAKKGMDSSQLTGATSSYARKYALNGLLCIDDNKDMDSNEVKRQIDKKNGQARTPMPMTKEQMQIIANLNPELKEKIRKKYKKEPLNISYKEAEITIKGLLKRGLIVDPKEVERKQKESEEVF